MDHRPPAIFVGDAPGLDFLNSVATPADATIDWLEQARLVPPDVLRDMRARARPEELDQLADQARRLRGWFRSFVHRHKGRPLGEAAFAELHPLNRLLERDETFARIAPGATPDAPFALHTMRRWSNPGTLLLPLGEALARLVCSEDFSHVKACEGATCTLLFADHTRGHARRWCSMAICGNRAKQAAHRHRLRTRRHPVPSLPSP